MVKNIRSILPILEYHKYMQVKQKYFSYNRQTNNTKSTILNFLIKQQEAIMNRPPEPTPYHFLNTENSTIKYSNQLQKKQINENFSNIKNARNTNPINKPTRNRYKNALRQFNKYKKTLLTQCLRRNIYICTLSLNKDITSPD